MRRLLFICFLFLPVLVKSQVWRDTLFLNPQAASIVDISLLRHALADSTLRDYGRVDLFYNRSAGAYRRSQQAYTAERIAFYAEGSKKLGRIGISGNFTFDKVYEDSLANSIRSDQHPLSPFYHYASKAGNYERQNYKANMTLSYDLVPGRLSPFLHVNYGTHWSTGSVDPRLESKIFMMKLNPGLAYRMKNGTTMGIMAITGRTKEQITVNYKSDFFGRNMSVPERIRYFNLGYGQNKLAGQQLRKYTDHLGTELSLKKQLTDWDLRTYARYERAIEENTLTPGKGKNYEVESRFTLQQYSGRVLLTKVGVARDHQLELKIASAIGEDRNVLNSPTLSLVNYQVRQNLVNLSYGLLFNKQQANQQELGLQLYYAEESRSDAATATKLDARQLRLSPYYRSYLLSSATGMLVARVAPFYSQPLWPELNLSPGSANAFTRDVVYTDYYYFSSKVAGADLGLSWISRDLLKGNLLEFSLEAQYQHQLSTSEIDYPAGFVPGKSRTQTVAGVKLLF